MASQRSVLPILTVTALLATGLILAPGPAATEGATEAKDQIERQRPPPTTTLRVRKDDHVFNVTVEPGRPESGRRVALRLDLATIPLNPDPTFGDRLPVRDASLVAVLTSPDGGQVHQSLHPLGGAGAYGMHWTPGKPGMWRLSIERRGADLPENGLQIGVGIDTPVQDDASLGRGPGGPTRILGGLERGGRGGAVVGPLTPIAAGPTAASVMKSVSNPAGWLTGALADPGTGLSASDAVEGLRAELASLAGTVPDRYRVAEEDYDRLANELVQRLAGLAATIESGEMAKAQTEWRAVLDQTCAQCHVKFWWGVSHDLSSWPHVRHQPWQR